ncbi:MAG: hypothetical protein IT300_12860 [Dehalococcoidia bacterium]|nr:hypothetical protein [Dehalococcoidia bacterium]
MNDTDERISLKDGVLAGALRRPINRAANVKGSIHDDETATKLGLRGGTVAGSVHMDLFGPLLMEAFGESWWEKGTLSLYFQNATTDREPVRAFMVLPLAGARDAQVDVWVEREDGLRVAEGTASVGSPGEPTALMRKPLDRFDPGELRILKDLAPGDPIAATEGMVTQETVDKHLLTTTDPMDIYRSSKWGKPVVPITSYVGLFFTQGAAPVRRKLHDVVGLFGAIEIRNIHGPLLVDEPYHLSGEIVALGQSPKTEYYWYETWADDAGGKRIAEHRMLSRFMKASSPLYQ